MDRSGGPFCPAVAQSEPDAPKCINSSHFRLLTGDASSNTMELLDGVTGPRESTRSAVVRFHRKKKTITANRFFFR